MRNPHSALIESGQAKIDVQCIECNEAHQLTVPAENYLDWQNGAYIQKALNTLTIDQRELLMSGYCANCWNKVLGEEE